nr:hypothetical protein [uncultured Draconibacterium sp.]
MIKYKLNKKGADEIIVCNYLSGLTLTLKIMNQIEANTYQPDSQSKTHRVKNFVNFSG